MLINRNELQSYIENCLLIGKVCTEKDILYAYEKNGSWNPGYEINSHFELFVGSVEIDGMYFKMSNDNIILTLCLSDYKKINLGDAVDIIGPLAFAWNRKIYKLIAPAVQSIACNCFNNCSIAYAEFKSLTNMDKCAFNLSSIRKIKIPKLEIIDSCVFSDCMHLESVNAPKVTRICSYAFSGSAIRKITTEELVFIGENAFFLCDNLKVIDAPKLKIISESAFKYCTNLIDVKFTLLDYIGAFAFKSCNSLRSFNTKKVNRMSDWAFKHSPLDDSNDCMP